MTDIATVTADGVTTITLDRLEKRNALTAAMYSELADALDAASDDPTVRVVAILGHATVFSAGNDIADFLRDPPRGADAPVMRFLRTIAGFAKPLVAAACGPAVGVGTTMLLHCDLVYAGDNARFSTPFVDLGLVPEAASSLLLPRMIGYHRAAELLLMSERMTADAALAAGIVTRVVPSADANALALVRAHELAAKPLAAVMETKRLMKSVDDGVEQRIRDEAAVFERLLDGPAAREAFTAFLEKRSPDFSGL